MVQHTKDPFLRTFCSFLWMEIGNCSGDLLTGPILLLALWVLLRLESGYRSERQEKFLGGSPAPTLEERPFQFLQAIGDHPPQTRVQAHSMGKGDVIALSESAHITQTHFLGSCFFPFSALALTKGPCKVGSWMGIVNLVAHRISL